MEFDRLVALCPGGESLQKFSNLRAYVEASKEVLMAKIEIAQLEERLRKYPATKESTRLSEAGNASIWAGKLMIAEAAVKEAVWWIENADQMAREAEELRIKQRKEAEERKAKEAAERKAKEEAATTA